MIEVRIKLIECFPHGAVEQKLEAAGVPPYQLRRDGLMQWWDAKTDEFVYEYYEPDEMRLPQAKPGANAADTEGKTG